MLVGLFGSSSLFPAANLETRNTVLNGEMSIYTKYQGTYHLILGYTYQDALHA